MAFDRKKLLEQVKSALNTASLPQVVSGYAPPKQGQAWARFVGYFETGKHEYVGSEEALDTVELHFELSGPNHPPRKIGGGLLVPVRITTTEILRLDYTSRYRALFDQMNYAGKARHMAELLGDALVVEVFHRKSSDGKRTYATMKATKDTLPTGHGYNIRGTSFPDQITGKPIRIPVPEPITELKAFIWNSADMDDWNSIFIEGKYDDRTDEKTKVVTPGKSKNVIQNKIMSAVNWRDHPLSKGLDQLSGNH
jgi:hypothetical protein